MAKLPVTLKLSIDSSQIDAMRDALDEVNDALGRLRKLRAEFHLKSPATRRVPWWWRVLNVASPRAARRTGSA